MKRKQGISLLFVLLFVFTTSTHAWAAKIQLSNVSINHQKEVRIEGHTTGGANKEVSIMIMDPKENIEYMYQTKSGADGLFSFGYKMTNSEEGFYEVVVGGEGVSSAVYDRFLFIPSPIQSDVTMDVVWKVGNQAGATALVGSKTLVATVTATNTGGTEREVMMLVALCDQQNEIMHMMAGVPVILEAGKTEWFRGGFRLPNHIDGYKARAWIVDADNWDTENPTILAGSAPISQG